MQERKKGYMKDRKKVCMKERKKVMYEEKGEQSQILTDRKEG